MSDRPDTSRLQDWLNLRTGWQSCSGDQPWCAVVSHAASAAWEVLTWLRWKTGRGPWCGDGYCGEDEHWPGGRVPAHVAARRDEVFRACADRAVERYKSALDKLAGM